MISAKFATGKPMTVLKKDTRNSLPAKIAIRLFIRSVMGWKMGSGVFSAMSVGRNIKAPAGYATTQVEY